MPADATAPDPAGAPAPVILAMDFCRAPSDDPAVHAALQALAESIAADTPGLLWKIWTHDAARGRAGGLYAFRDRGAALAYQAMHTARVEAHGATDTQAQFGTPMRRWARSRARPCDGCHRPSRGVPARRPRREAGLSFPTGPRRA